MITAGVMFAIPLQPRRDVMTDGKCGVVVGTFIAFVVAVVVMVFASFVVGVILAFAVLSQLKIPKPHPAWDPTGFKQFARLMEYMFCHSIRFDLLVEMLRLPVALFIPRARDC
jgi:hypothetical protein